MDNASFFRNFINWLFIKPKNVERYYDPELHPINTEKLYKELKIETRAKELGEANQPSSSDVNLSGVEREIIQQVDIARQDYLVWASQRLQVLNQEIAKIDISVEINKANQADQEFERQANELLNESGSLLCELKETANQKRIELEDFKLRNELNRLAVYPSGTSVILQYGLLALLVCIEGALNSVLFAKGVSNGYIGGFLYALMFAVTNVVISFINGLHFLRYINHIKFSKQLIGIFSILIWFSTSIPIAFLTAHFRDALSAIDVESPSALALQNLVNQPFGLQDTQSWLLLLISIIFGVVAYLDGKSLKDPYPGYSDIEKRAKEALDDYQLELDDVRNNLKKLKDDTLEEIDDILKTSKQKIDELHRIIQGKKALESKIKYSLENVKNCMSSLISRFRDINKTHRKTESPKYFSKLIQLEELEPLDFSINSDIEKYQNQSLIYAKYIEKVDEIRAHIQSSFNKKHDSLLPLAEHFDTSDGIYEKKIISFKKTGS